MQGAWILGLYGSAPGLGRLSTALVRVYANHNRVQWSRFSGGSGAPYWTLLACGLNPRNFMATNAAVIQCEWPDPKAPSPLDFPDMVCAEFWKFIRRMS
jgi:hypothetical protein